MPAYVLDTCFISELVRPRPSAGVSAWFDRHEAQCCLTSIVVMELDIGAALQTDPALRPKLRDRNRRIVERFKGERRLVFDDAAAERTAEILADARRTGRPLGVVDAQILGIAASMRAAVATRDGDFAGRGVEVVNPWLD